MLSSLDRTFDLVSRYGPIFAQFEALCFDFAQQGLSAPQIAIKFQKALRRDFSGTVTANGLSALRVPPPPEDASSALRVMTVHGSKGLEFPAVILSDTSRSLKPKRLSPLFDRGQFWVPVPDARDLGAQWPEYETAYSVKSEAEGQESARLLYVAMTRAQQTLLWAECDEVEEEKRRKGWASWLWGGFTRSLGAPLVSRSRNSSTETPSEHELTSSVPSLGTAITQGTRRISITELIKTASAADDRDHSKGAVFAELSAEQAAELGTAVHGFLEIGDFQGLRLFESSQKGLDLKAFWRWLETPEADLVFPKDPNIEVESEFSFEHRLEGQIRVGRMDRLVIDRRAGLVRIIDFKVTTRVVGGNAPLPDAYRQQLSFYAQALRGMDPGLRVETYILDVLGKNSPSSMGLLHLIEEQNLR